MISSSNHNALLFANINCIVQKSMSISSGSFFILGNVKPYVTVSLKYAADFITSSSNMLQVFFLQMMNMLESNALIALRKLLPNQ